MIFFRLLIIGLQRFPDMQKQASKCAHKDSGVLLSCKVDKQSCGGGLTGDGLPTSWHGDSCQVHSPHMIRNDAQFPDCCSSARAKILGSFHWLLPIRPQIVSCEGNSSLHLQMRRITQNACGTWNTCCISGHFQETLL